jgi:hypothetical protein
MSLRQRLESLEQTLQPGRFLVLRLDPVRDRREQIEAFRAENGVTARHPRHPPKLCHLRGASGSRRATVVISSFRTRLEQLEAKIAPKDRHLVFVHFEDAEPDALSRDEQLSAFKAERGLAPGDLIHEVTVTFA